MNKEVANKSIIIIPYAENPKMKAGTNISKAKDRFEVYMKNCCVACLSAKVNNPNSHVALVTNTTVPEKYSKLLLENNCLIINAAFDHFKFPDDYRWGLAFYKLCALKHVAETGEYDYYAYLDADTYTQGTFEHIWKECDQNILMYDINHGLQVENYKKFLKQIEDFAGVNKYVTQYGGEFFAANQENALQFINKCDEIYKKMLEQSFVTTSGDEFISTLAAFDMREKVKNAGAYVYRFWTGYFRLISTQYERNSVVVLHVPDEKEKGMLKLFDYFSKKGEFPSNRKVHHLLHLKRPYLKIFIKRLLSF